MALSIEALIGIMTLLVTCPPSVLVVWRLFKRRRQNSETLAGIRQLHRRQTFAFTRGQTITIDNIETLIEAGTLGQLTGLMID
ncbi:uncharacterized protein BDZ99DRAFT_457104 [Mytilinidion resinicola]|uniref:Uncharacterized protein n=1 Tax=Mytilinidion resinicola TaxID=574789 RepID=A0A6A6Z8M9_9PEZI|nr:uncharacterized protein BDZ99DRAFT_457104 [Mytilinidion resinicola]KAF2817366.1 hypothetical protein BDZ99DRAFT_457104 [Mytilinidion resinicola]